MAKILLDYVFPISVISPTPAASTAFLKQVCVVAKPKAGQEGNVGELYECVTMTEVNVRIANTNGAVSQVQQLFNAGMNKVFILLADDLDLESFLDEHGQNFYTVLISSDFDDADISADASSPAVFASKKIQDILYTAKDAGVAGNDITITYVDDGTAGSETVGVSTTDITVHMEDGASTAQNIADAIEDSVAASALVEVAVDAGDESDKQAAETETALENGADAGASGDGLLLGTFEGVVGVSSDDLDILDDQAAIENRCAFYGNSTNKAKNMFYAFGKLLSNAVNWRNQQYITMPFNDGLAELGSALSAFDDRISFVLNDDEFGNRLALFACGGKAIVAPYILKNLRVDMQSAGLQWISGNQPQYTKKEAALLETRLQEDVVNSYITRQWIEAGVVAISLVNDNFVATGAINVAEPKALWRIEAEMLQTL